jgi:hypothetical protein
MTYDDVKAIVALITLPTGWSVRTMVKGDGFLVQIVFMAPNFPDETPKLQSCRKWYVSSFATVTEVVRTVYKAGKVALEHEYDEQFMYRGVALFHPHQSIEDLVDNAAISTEKDVRGEPQHGQSVRQDH